MSFKKILKYALFALVGLFALIGLLFSAVFLGMQVGLFNVPGSIAVRNAFFPEATSTLPCLDASEQMCTWSETPEWDTVAGGLGKDQAVIARVSSETGVPARVIASVVVPEQIRFFTSERDVFKRYFEPLKILGSLSQFSLGVSGIKPETASLIEEYAASTTSPFYPGAGAAALLVYTPGATTTLYGRLTDPDNHYYSYLYTALYIKEVEAQWQRAGYDISGNAGIIATLFNIGFQNSHPNATPQLGGASIEVGGETYAYGQLAADFYDSGQLVDIFPR